MYSYQKQKRKLYTDVGQKMLLTVFATVNELLSRRQKFTAEEAWQGVDGDSWTMVACLDHLVKLGFIRESKRCSCYSVVLTQHTIYERA